MSTTPDALATTKAILALPGYRMIQGGRVVDMASLDPESLGNFYHVLAMSTIAGDYRNVAEGAILALTADAALVPPEIAALLRQIPDAPTQEAYVALRDRILATFPDPADPVGEQVREIMVRFDDGWAFITAARRTAVAMSERACQGLDWIGQEARTLFGSVRPMIQEMMGRPAPDRQQALAEGFESADQRLNQLLDDYRQQLLGMLAPDDKVPTPLAPLDAPENQPAMRTLQRRLGAVLAHAPERVDTVVDGLQRSASLLMTVATALDQLEDQLGALGLQPSGF
jgi:hypothetical protein